MERQSTTNSSVWLLGKQLYLPVTTLYKDKKETKHLNRAAITASLKTGRGKHLWVSRWV